MDTQTILIFASVTAVAALLGYSVMSMMAGPSNGKMRNRLVGKATHDGTRPTIAPRGVVPLLQKIGQSASQPFMPKTREAQSDLRRRLGFAGIYTNSAIKLVTGSKVIFLGIGLICGYIAGTFMGGFAMLMASLCIGGVIGYMLPMFWLRYAIKSNGRALTYGLADALDLMVVCVEAGLTVDSSMQRVGQEMALAHPAIAREFGITHMETRVGLSRMESLKNLGVRTGNEPLQSLAAMLIQAERFGTSIATALRVHADTLRTNRFHTAEESAAKASVKMSFPLVLFIFPATFIVLAGPTIIGLMQSPLFN